MSGGDLSWPLQRAAQLNGGALGAPRVGFLGVNSLAHRECRLGGRRHGVLVDLNVRLAEDELAFMVDDAGLELLIVDRAQHEVGQRLVPHGRPRSARTRTDTSTWSTVPRT